MNIYIGNLSYEVTEEELKQAFEAFGEVESVKIIKDRYTNRSYNAICAPPLLKGFCFYHF
jgi:RNA recognition motif-containing protein